MGLCLGLVLGMFGGGGVGGERRKIGKVEGGKKGGRGGVKDREGMERRREK